jgi:GntR family transcriptional regulator
MSLHRLKRAAIPLYVQIADLIRQRIGRGQWPAGTRLPTLEALVEEFGVARVTVRQAMDIVSAEGLVARRQGRGTFVAAPPQERSWLRVETSLDALAKVYAGTRPRLLTITDTIASAPLAREDGKPAPRYRFMHRVHSKADDVPYALISIWLDARIFQRAPRRFRNETVIPLLESMPGIEIARARQTLTIGSADVETAELLRVPLNAPTAEVRRVFNAPDETVIYLAEVIYRGDFIRLEMDLKK